MWFAHGSRPRLAAIVDWEMTTVGDPLLDLAWALLGYDDENPQGRRVLSGQFVADSYTELIPFRLTVLHAAWLIDNGDEHGARAEIAACKILASQVLKSIALR